MEYSAQDLCVAKVPLFAKLGDDDLFEVASRAHPIKRSAGEIIHRPGEDLPHLLVVHRGRVGVSHVDNAGNERLVRVLEENDFIGEYSFITGTRPDYLATAMTDVELCSFNHAELNKLVEQYPAIAVQMLRTVSARLDSAERFIAELTTTPVAARLARYLIDLPTKRENGVVSVELPISKKDIASLLGTTPETLSRQLASFADTGLITISGNHLQILDEPALLDKAQP